MKSSILFFKTVSLIIYGASIACMYSCGGNENKSDSVQTEKSVEENKITDRETSINISNPYAKGEEIYKRTCQACHQANGEGLPNAFPPLAKSDYLLADKARAINQIIMGSTGEITVNGQKYNSTMPPQNLSDEEVADVLNYVLHNWENDGELVTAEEVKTHRGS
ncbi:MAG: cytochrome c [Bacteroidia bacterium]